ncbi:MAG: twin-arginine translocase subunit TatC [Nitrososphaerales archaeon]|jgi:sec-independent protein translocase protein TatC
MYWEDEGPLTDQPETIKKEGEQATVEGSRMSIFDHMAELANRLKKCLYAFIIAFAAVTSVPNPFHPFGGVGSLFGYNFLVISLLRYAEVWTAKNFQFFSPTLTTPISVWINLSLALSVIITLPILFGQIYGFIAPGLYSREKNAVRKYILPFAILFTIGAIFGLLVIFPTVMRILLIFFNGFQVAPLVSLSDFVNLLILIPVMTGIGFTFPVFIIPLVELKVIKAKQLSGVRKWVYILVALAVGLVNPDPTFISSIPIVVPVYVLYEATVLYSKRIEKKRMKTAVEVIPK